MNWRQRAEVLRAVPLPQVLAQLDAVADPHDPAKWRTARGVLSVTGAKFFNWTQGTGGGGALDLVMDLRQVGFGQALQWLEERFGLVSPTPPTAQATAHTLSLPAPTPHLWPRVERYLIEDRRLPRSLLAPLVRAGLLYADARANAVFLLGASPATAVGAELRGTCLRRGFGRQATSAPWRGLAPGSRKDAGFFSACAASPQAIVLCESAIDAISCHALYPAYRCLSTSGARPDPAWLPALLHSALPVFCGFDADPVGDAMAQRMIELHPAIVRLRPPAKDWNDALRLHPR